MNKIYIFLILCMSASLSVCSQIEIQQNTVLKTDSTQLLFFRNLEGKSYNIDCFLYKNLDSKNLDSKNSLIKISDIVDNLIQEIPEQGENDYFSLLYGRQVFVNRRRVNTDDPNVKCFDNEYFIETSILLNRATLSIVYSVREVKSDVEKFDELCPDYEYNSAGSTITRLYYSVGAFLLLSVIVAGAWWYKKHRS